MCGLPIDPAEPNPSPLQGVVDEVVPVSRGGSPYDPGNCRAAHRCCNAWRSDKPERLVLLVRQRVASLGVARDPLEWIRMAKVAERDMRRGVESREPPRPSLDW
jgi:hypothetical protein